MTTLNQSKNWKALALFFFAIIIFTQVFDVTITSKLSFLRSYFSDNSELATDSISDKIDITAITGQVISRDGVILPITWGDLGKQMIKDGVIDEAKFRALFEGGLSNLDEQILTGKVDEPIVLSENNARFMLDMLWAFGLANKNDILETGEMTDTQYGGAQNFASTGGWSLSKGTGFSHYSKHSYLVLTQDQQALVDKVSRNIYRPCCGNSTHFPDCNHGMAMLGLLELMASAGISEAEMYKVALQVNSYWFPQTYIDLATYFKEQGTNWSEVDPKTVLSAEYSSAQGYQTTRQKIQSLPKLEQSGSGCGA